MVIESRSRISPGFLHNVLTGTSMITTVASFSGTNGAYPQAGVPLGDGAEN